MITLIAIVTLLLPTIECKLTFERTFTQQQIMSNIIIKGHYLYAAGQRGVALFDLLGSSTAISQWSSSDVCSGLALDKTGNYLFTTHVTEVVSFDLSVLPLRPLDTVQSTEPLFLTVDEDRSILFASGTTTLQSINITDPSNMVKLSSNTIAGNFLGRRLSYTKNRLYLSWNGGISLYDASAPAALWELVGVPDCAGVDIAFSVSVVYAKCQNKGPITIYNTYLDSEITIPPTSDLAKSLVTTSSFSVTQNYLYIGGMNGLYEFDIRTDYASPTLEDSVMGTYKVVSASDTYVAALEASGRKIEVFGLNELTDSPPTPLPSTQTPATDAPPTAVPTDAPPTAAPPTDVPPTAVPTDAPPTAVPPTDVPPTAVPTDAPPTGAPPTDAPPTAVPTDAPPTSVPPTDVPPTAVPTDAPPTAAPPTDTPTAVPTDAPPTGTPPTDIPPTTSTASPATSSPPTDIPPTSAPPTGIPQTTIPNTLIPESSHPSTPFPETPTPQTSTPKTDSPPINTGTSISLTEVPIKALIPTVIPATVEPIEFTSPPEPKVKSNEKAQGSAIVVAAVVSAPTAVLLMQVEVLMGPCYAPSELDKLPMLLHPTQMSVAGHAAAGAIVFNVIITIGVYVLFRVLGAIVSSVSKIDPSAFFRFPSIPIFIFLFLYQGTVLASFMLVFGLHNPLLTILGAVSLFLCVGIPVVTCNRVVVQCRSNAFVFNDSSRGRIATYILGKGEWINHNKGYDWVNRYTHLVKTYRKSTVWFTILKVMSSFSVSAAYSLRSGSRENCAHVRICSSIVMLSMLVLVMYTRPYRRPRDNHFTAMYFFCLSISLVLLSCSYYQPPKSSSAKLFESMSAAANIVVLIVIGIKLVTDACSELYLIVKGVRNKLQQKYFDIIDRRRLLLYERQQQLSDKEKHDKDNYNVGPILKNYQPTDTTIDCNKRCSEISNDSTAVLRMNPFIAEKRFSNGSNTTESRIRSSLLSNYSNTSTPKIVSIVPPFRRTSDSVGFLTPDSQSIKPNRRLSVFSIPPLPMRLRREFSGDSPTESITSLTLSDNSISEGHVGRDSHRRLSKPDRMGNRFRSHSAKHTRAEQPFPGYEISEPLASTQGRKSKRVSNDSTASHVVSQFSI